MAKRNYNKISTKPPVDVEQEAVELDANETVEVDPVPEDPKPVFGVVANCGRLNVRKKPDIKAEVVCEVPIGSVLMLDMDKSTSGWFKVCTAAGSEGFCMKDFVESQ